MSSFDLDKLIAIVPDMVCIAGTDGYFKYLNPEWERVLGYSREVLMSRPLFEFIHPDDHEPTRREIQRQIRGLQTIHFENRYRCKDGSYKILEWRAAPAAKNRLFAVARDMTERRHAEQRLQKSEAFLNATEAVTRSGGWELDLETGQIIWTDEVYRIYGVDPDTYDPSDIARDMRFYAPESRPILEQAFERALTDGEAYDLQLAFIRANGEKIWVRTIGNPRIENNRVVRIAGNIVDITDYKKMERESERTLSLLKTVYESLDEAVFVVEPNTRVILSCNDAAEKIFGYRKEEMVGKNTEFVHVDQKKYREFGRKLTQSLETDGRLQMEFSLKKKDGSVFPSEHTAVQVRDQSGLPVILVSVVRDITLQKRTMESLKKKHRELLEKTKRLDEMNTALKVLLEQREKDKKTSEEQLMDNITGFIIPYLDKIRKTGLRKPQKEYMDILESNLRNIVTPYNHRISAKLMRLSPTETRVADLVIKGYRIKEMADVMNVSARTIEFHRDNIRAKLGIKGKKINLRTYLTNT